VFGELVKWRAWAQPILQFVDLAQDLACFLPDMRRVVFDLLRS